MPLCLRVERRGDGRDRYGQHGHQPEQHRAVTLMPRLVSQRLPLPTLERRFGDSKLDQRHHKEHRGTPQDGSRRRSGRETIHAGC